MVFMYYSFNYKYTLFKKKEKKIYSDSTRSKDPTGTHPSPVETDQILVKITRNKVKRF